MARLKYSSHCITLDVPYDQAYAYLSDWRNQPEWAINFVRGVRQEREQIIISTPFGDLPIEWRTHAELGVIDIVCPGAQVLPTRLLASGDGLLYTFTFSVPADMPEPAFRAAQQGVEEELQTLKRILEQGAQAGATQPAAGPGGQQRSRAAAAACQPHPLRSCSHAPQQSSAQRPHRRASRRPRESC